MDDAPTMASDAESGEVGRPWPQPTGGQPAPLERELDAASRLYDEARYRAETGEVRARRLRRLSTTLGFLATALAAVAAVTVIPQNSVAAVTGITAGLSALVSGLRTAFNPGERARVVAALSLRWQRLADDIDAEARAARDGLEDMLGQSNEGGSSRIRRLRADFEERITPLRDRRDSLALEESGSPEAVLERAERAFKTAEAHERQVTQSVVNLSLTYMRGLYDDLTAAAQAGVRRMLSGAVDDDGVERVVDEVAAEVRGRLRERERQFVATLRAAAPDAFGHEPAVASSDWGGVPDRSPSLSGLGYQLVRPPAT